MFYDADLVLSVECKSTYKSEESPTEVGRDSKWPQEQEQETFKNPNPQL